MTKNSQYSLTIAKLLTFCCNCDHTVETLINDHISYLCKMDLVLTH